MTKQKKVEVYIPKAIFFGRLFDRGGRPVQGVGHLYPLSDTRAFFCGDRLYGMKNYHFPIKDGRFCVDVLPTNYGVEREYHYAFETPVHVWEITLPGPGPHDFREMLSRAKTK